MGFYTVLVFVLVMVVIWRTASTAQAPIQEEWTNWSDVEDYLFTHPVLATQISTPPGQSKADLVKFYLYPPEARTRFKPDELNFSSGDSLVSSRFNPRLPVKIFIHGFTMAGNCTYPQVVKNAYILNGYNYNIIIVDWGALSMNFSMNDASLALGNYRQAVENVPIVGQRLGDLINTLFQYKYTKLSQVHIVGFSLGAHVAGYAGAAVYKKWMAKVGRITGLDPAGPLFRNGKIGRHLSKEDADFVDFIHTDSGQSGTTLSLGHVNFYVNGGYPPQPGCLGSLLKMNFLDALPGILGGSCSHNTAWNYYMESFLQKEKYIQAKSCGGYLRYQAGLCFLNSKTKFGEFCQPGITGEYYLNLKPLELQSNYGC